MEKYRTDAIDKLMKSLQDELDLVESHLSKSMVTVPTRQKEREREVQPIKRHFSLKSKFLPKSRDKDA